MKKTVAIVLSAMMLITVLAACGTKKAEDSAEPSTPVEESVAPETSTAPETSVAPETSTAPETSVAPEASATTNG